MPKYPQIVEAIKSVRSKIRWKPNSATRHLQKRKRRGHLPLTASLEEYEHIISNVVQDKAAHVYLYWYKRVAYVAVVSEIEEQQWLVMFAYNGVLESAFVLERPSRYLNKPGFEEIGLLSEVNDEL
ncbi:MAG: hypothetical protein MAG431_01707 [Chloroflexi bacterium]|nr:hypothetical protein [Chloroflexota bacterium]